MFARCTISQGPPDIVEQAIEVTREQVVPMGREIEGFMGMLEFVDRESGKWLTFTLWESAEAREASAERAKAIRSDVTQQLSATVLAVENYELVIDER